MPFIDNDRLECSREARQPCGPTQGLHAGEDAGGVDLIPRRLDNAQVQCWRDDLKLLRGLPDQLIAVDEHESPAPALLDEMRKDHGLARPCGEGEERPPNPARLGRVNGREGLYLVRS